ncbi:MAG: GNAT family N-acetyltransferase [Oscillospiraceae bacterium]|nr:GNAT family N-acetyltransferase [Oscillospiraceae bacterium]
MHMQLIEKPEWLYTEDSFAIYRHCMYKPTFEAYKNKIADYLNDPNTRIFECLAEDRISGMIVLTGKETAELRGIAVSADFQKRGIGTFMIGEAAKKMNISQITAETDDDAVGFYKKAGFAITKEIKKYGDEEVVRYRCLLAL